MCTWCRKCSNLLGYHWTEKCRKHFITGPGHPVARVGFEKKNILSSHFVASYWITYNKIFFLYRSWFLADLNQNSTLVNIEIRNMWIDDVSCRKIFFGHVSIKFQHEFSGNYCAKISGKNWRIYCNIIFPWWWWCYCIAFTTKKTDLSCFKPSLHSSFVWHYISVNINQKQPRWFKSTSYNKKKSSSKFLMDS